MRCGRDDRNGVRPGILGFWRIVIFFIYGRMFGEDGSKVALWFSSML